MSRVQTYSDGLCSQLHGSPVPERIGVATDSTSQYRERGTEVYAGISTMLLAAYLRVLFSLAQVEGH